MRTLIGGLAAAAWLAGTGLAMGQDGQSGKTDATPSDQTAPAAQTPAVPPPQGPRAQSMFTVHGEHTFEADLKDSPGSVAIDRAGADFSMRFPVGDRSRLTASLGTELSFYDFKNATGFAAGITEPWDDTLEMTGSVSFSSQATRQWSWYAGGGIDDSIERDADYGKGITGGLFGGVNYAFSERLSIGVGAQLRSRLEGSGEVLPIPFIDWQIADKWKLSTHSDVTSTALTLSYQPLEQLTLSLNAANEQRDYRLDDAAASPQGVGRDHRIPVYVGAAWNITRQVSLSGHLGVDAYQEYTLVDSTSNDVAKVKTKPAVLFGASLTLSF